MIFQSLDEIQLDSTDNSNAVKKVIASRNAGQNHSMERPIRGHSHLSNGRESAERRYNSLERYLRSPSNGSVTRIKQNKDYEKIKRI